MKKLLLYRWVAFILAIGFLSCTEEQDFNQFDDLSVTPTVASSIFYLESDETFINASPIVGNFYSQIFNFDPFSEQFVAERLLEGVLIYEVENTTSKQLNLGIEFLDDANNVLDFELFSIDPDPTQPLTREITYGPGGRSLDILRNTSNLRVTGQNLGDNTSTSSASEPRLIMRSAAEFLFRLK